MNTLLLYTPDAGNHSNLAKSFYKMFKACNEYLDSSQKVAICTKLLSQATSQTRNFFIYMLSELEQSNLQQSLTTILPKAFEQTGNILPNVVFNEIIKYTP